MGEGGRSLSRLGGPYEPAIVRWRLAAALPTQQGEYAHVCRSVLGIGGMAGAVGGMLIAEIVGYVLQRTGSYLPVFIMEDFEKSFTHSKLRLARTD